MTKSVVSKKETPTDWVKTMIAERVKSGLAKTLKPIFENDNVAKTLMARQDFSTDASRSIVNARRSL